MNDNKVERVRQNVMMLKQQFLQGGTGVFDQALDDRADDRLIPDILRAITDGRPVNIRNPHAVRPWQHVLEPLSGYLQLAQKLCEEGTAFADGWNFGPNDEDAKPVQ